MTTVPNTAPERDPRRTWRLPSVEGSLPLLRRELGVHLNTSTLSADERYDLSLSVSEAASNAVEHAPTPREPFLNVAAVIEDATVTVTVHNPGRWLPPTDSRLRGRGVLMMHQLTDATVATAGGRTTVTMRKLSAAPSATT
jgi:anti-sigma regulatory factor (Ser/Thr protein kinase)